MGCGIFTVVLTVVRKVTELILKVLARLMIYFGLYIPFLWFVLGLFLTLFHVVDIFTPTNLLYAPYWTGFFVCLLIAAIISVKHLIFNPIAGVFRFLSPEKSKTEQPLAKYDENEIAYREYELQNGCQSQEKPDRSDVYPEPENFQPEYTVLRNERYPDIVIHDYPTYRLYYRYVDGRMVLLGKREKRGDSDET